MSKESSCPSNISSSRGKNTFSEQILISLTAWCPDIHLTNNETEMVIGRSAKCFATVGLPHISSQHCLLKRHLLDPALIHVKDLSRNGTYINSKRVSSNEFEVLRTGDTLSLLPPDNKSAKAVAYIYRDSLSSGEKESILSKGQLHNFDVKICKLLGKGSFGQVYLGVTDKKEQRAIKIIYKGRSDPQRIVEEVKVLDKLNHPHIVGVHTVWDTNCFVAMSMDLALGGDLDTLLRQMGRLSEADSKSLFIQILNALVYLHENKVIHRDLKPENVLIKKPVYSAVPHLLLTDFGLSRIVDTESLHPAKTVCGTMYYIAPEILMMRRQQGNGPTGYNELVDLWSAGIMLFKFLTGAVPWEDSPSLDQQILCAAKPEAYLVVIPDLSVQGRDLLKKLVVEASSRILAKDAVQHDWFEEPRRKVSGLELVNDTETQGLLPDGEDSVPDRFTQPLLQNKNKRSSNTRRDDDKRVRETHKTDSMYY